MRTNFTKIRSGFLLVEALISIGILIMVASTGITLLVLAQRAINFNANSLEASWLAQEGVNSFRGLRDSNWLRYSYDKGNCWDIAEGPCNGARIQTGTYRLETSLTELPVLTGTTQPVDLSDGVDLEDEEYLLYYQDLDPATDYDGDGEIDNDLQFVGHGGGVKASKFFREFDVNKLISTNEIEAVVNVHWLEGSSPKKISLPVTITNYLLEE